MQFTRFAATAALIALATAAAGQANPFGGFKHDRSQPIEIVSDSLEVRQADSVVIFSGTVEAGQGTLRLNADTVFVTYDEDAQDSETGAIQNMRAEGNVFVTNGAETAEGDFAEYDVAAGRIVMRQNVVLTQGRNALSGEQLNIDLNTGVARMVGRVRTIFRPNAVQAEQN